VGKNQEIINQVKGEVQKVEVFVAVLSASQPKYVVAAEAHKKEDFLSAI